VFESPHVDLGGVLVEQVIPLSYQPLERCVPVHQAPLIRHRVVHVRFEPDALLGCRKARPHGDLCAPHDGEFLLAARLLIRGLPAPPRRQC
jgi:hypothetical protein